MFEHNQHQLQWAKDNWKRLGFNRFKVIYNKRLDGERLNRNLKDNKRARMYEDAQMIKNVAYKPKNKPIKTIMDELNPTKYDEIKKITQLRTVKAKNQSFIVEGDIIQQNKFNRERIKLYSSHNAPVSVVNKMFRERLAP